MEFESFTSIERLQQPIIITEKIHGTNAQIMIEGDAILAGSRTRTITTEDDNYGFAAWVKARAEQLKGALSEGRHFGEWYGSGINAGYGLKERRFVLFNTTRWAPAKEAGMLPEGIDVVPVLYQGAYTAGAIDTAMSALKASGSLLVPGYMKPEGVVIFWTRTNTFMKRTFEAEDAAWNYKADKLPQKDFVEIQAVCAPFWQPTRLEKLLSRDESFVLQYPSSLPNLCSAYITDLVKETEIEDTTLKLVKKNVFKAVKGMMAEKGYTA